MKNVLLVLFALVAALEAAFLVRQARELAVLRDTTAGQADALAAIEKRLAEKPVKTAAAPAPAAVRAPTEPAPVRFTAPTEQEVVESAAATERKKPDLGKLMAGIGSMMTNPAMKEMMRSQARMQMDMRYGRLFKFFELSPEDTEKLKTLLMDRQMAMMDSGMAFMDRNLTDEQRTARTKEMADRKKSYDDQLKALLGAEDYESLTQFEATEPERMQVDMFKHNLTGDDALTEQQEYDLVNAMYKARSESASSLMNQDPGTPPDPKIFTADGMKKAMEDMGKVQSAYNASAQTILSAKQYESFRKFADQQKAMQEMGMQMAAQMFGAGDKK